MDIRFLQHNSHLDGRENFLEVDPELCQLKTHALKYNSPVLEKLPASTPGIYTLCGGHRVGKTTLLKQWMEKLMQSGVGENAIAFFPGELISDYHELKNLLHKQIPNMPAEKIIYIIVDDINYVRDWEKGIKPLMDAGELNQAVIMLSSTARTLDEDANKYFSEKYKYENNNFHIYPLSFHETVLLKDVDLEKPKILFEEFNQYLIHGGYLNIINDIKTYGTISDKLISSYTDWLRKETVRFGKQERFLREILNAVVKHFNNQTTWNALAQELTIDHPKTIGDYFAFLESIDVVFIQYALLENSLSAAPKKARKLMFTDPFIFHAVQAWLTPTKNYYEKQISSTLSNPELCSRLVETSVITQFSRYYPTYYIKAEGEVELAYVYDERFWPIEITWESQMRAKDLKQILKYPNGRILTKTDRSGIIQHIRTEPLPLALWQLKELTSNR